MRIAVCIAMIPEFEKTFVHRTTGELRAIPAVLNPADENALELALTVKDAKEAAVVAVSCGSEPSESILRKAIAMGCDHGYHLMDSRFENSDPLAMTGILGQALKKIEPDLVICGAEALNGGQTGPRLAEYLGVPQIIQVTDVLFGDPLRVRRLQAGNEDVLDLAFPALITVLAGANTPRTPKALQIMKAHGKGVLTTWGLDDLGLDASKVGEKGSSLRTMEMYE